MASRLKRKLVEIGVDPTSSKATESFCLIGTPLPPLEKSRDTGEFVPVWNQDVRDEKGRRRLHGAFTGGFSAGYFNTVGSKEGWVPSTFVSSRSDRAKQKAARPEDFMDDEDLAELKDSQKLVDTNEEMEFSGKTQAEISNRGESENSIISALEESLLPAPRDSVGARILRKMGWRLGNGIGPKVTWEQRKQQDIQSSSTPSNQEDLHVEDDEATKHMFPPRDTKVPIFTRKDNFHGLGYVPGMGLTDIVLGSSKESTGKGGPNLSAGFGLGALNDAEDDDLDVYDRGFSQANSRLAYDEVEDEERIDIGMRNKNIPKPKSHLKAGSQPSSVHTFKDGRPVLAGFIPSTQPVADDKWFPLPEIPDDWIPNPRRVWEKDKKIWDGEGQNAKMSSSNTTGHASWKAGISADQRGSMLGEEPLPAAPRSVFDYMAPSDRERLKNMATGASQSTPDARPLPSPSISAVRVEPQIAKAALHGFQPFTADPVKQARYTAYLQSQAAMEDELPIKPSDGQSMNEFNKELSDYAKAAQIFKPVSGTMAGRFTSAAIVDLGMKPQEGLHKPSASEKDSSWNSGVGTEKEEKKEEKKEESPKEHAARIGMFGPLTRELKIWQPAKLLCKRFGVREPNPEPLTTDALATPSTSSTGTNSQQPMHVLADASFATSTGSETVQKGSSSRNNTRRDLANIGLGDDETQGTNILTYERPDRDIFKAIFASDDEDSNDGANSDEGDDEPPQPVAEIGQAKISSTVTTVPEASPVHHDIASTASTSYIPQFDTVNTKDEKVDLATFKPTFVPRSDREKNKSNGKEKPAKKEKKRKSGKAALVSFEVEEEVGVGKERESVRQKRVKRKERQAPDDEDDDMWIEKPPPAAIQELAAHLQPQPSVFPYIVANSDDPGRKESPQPRGRKRAIDFM